MVAAQRPYVADPVGGNVGITAGSGKGEVGTVKVVIVFESMFGNTERMASWVSDGLSDAGAHVTLVEVGNDVPDDFLGCDLLILAAPTHAMSLSRPQTRADAVAKGADAVHAAIGIREWLSTIHENIGPTSTRPQVAVFDSRVKKARHFPGSAARRTEKILTHEGFSVVDRTSFYVEDLVGPIVEGEQERARLWGRHLADIMQVSGTVGHAGH